MKIGVNCFLLQKNIGGIRQYFHRLFKELLDNDHENSYMFFYFEHNIIEMEHLNNNRWKENAILLEDQNAIKQYLHKIDLYFCPFGSLWPRPVQVPSVVTLVDIQEKYFPQFFSKQDLWNREYHYEGSTRVADGVITISEFSKDSIVRHHKISGDKIHVAYLAAEDYFYKPVTTDDIKLKLPERFIFYPANRWLHKNHDNLLKALVVLRNEYNLKIKCVFTGFDYDSGYPLKVKLKEYGLSEQASIIGYVSKEELKYIYKKAEMLCFPSLFEGFGMPLVEAMTAGCPVVCSNVTSMPEVAGEAALLFDPADPYDIARKIYMFYNNKELREKFIALGKARAGHFSIKETARVHMEAFELAAEAYSSSRYLYQKYLREPFHKFRMYSKWVR